MTILEASTRILDYFTKNDYFLLDNDFKKICLISDTDADKAAIIIAMEELAKQNFVFKREINGKEYWILSKPLLMQKQDVSISVELGVEISKIIDKIIPEGNEKCNPLNIQEGDIAHLIMILQAGELPTVENK